MIEISEKDGAGVMQVIDTARLPGEKSVGFIVKTESGKWLAIPHYCEGFKLRREAVSFLLEPKEHKDGMFRTW